MAVRAVKAVAGCWMRLQCDGDMFWLLFPFFFDFNRREELGRFRNWGCGPVRLLALRQRSDGGRCCRGRGEAAVSLGGE